jgi:NAD-dependent SIR2 family protein deacetylase
MQACLKVTGHPFWRFAKNRYLRAQNPSDFHQIFTKMHEKYGEVVKLTNNKIM